MISYVGLQGRLGRKKRAGITLRSRDPWQEVYEIVEIRLGLARKEEEHD
jgi:hypothetical protein